MRRTTVGLALAVLATAASAQRTILDDSLSPVDTLGVELAWRPGDVHRALAALAAGAPDPGTVLTGRIANVEVRLDTNAYVGESARIYLTLPAYVSGLGSSVDIELRWEAAGEFLAGSVRPGQSTLVYEGTVSAPVTRAVFNFVIAMGSGTDADTFDVEPLYEIELQ